MFEFLKATEWLLRVKCNTIKALNLMKLLLLLFYAVILIKCRRILEIYPHYKIRLSMDILSVIGIAVFCLGMFLAVGMEADQLLHGRSFNIVIVGSQNLSSAFNVSRVFKLISHRLESI